MTAGAYPGFCSIKRLGVLLLLLDGMLVHRRKPASISSGFPDSLLVSIYSWVERRTVRVKCLSQEHNTMTRPGLEPGPLAPESSTLTTRPPRLPPRRFIAIHLVKEAGCTEEIYDRKREALDTTLSSSCLSVLLKTRHSYSLCCKK